MKSEIMHRLVVIARLVNEYIDQKPESLKTEGVLRVPAAIHFAEQVTHQVDALQPVDLSEANPTNVLGLLSNMLSNQCLIDFESESLDEIRKTMKQFLADSVKPEDAAIALKKFVDTLLASYDLNQQRLGEILYRYLHIMHKVSLEAESNKMSADNLTLMAQAHFVEGAAFALTSIRFNTAEDLKILKKLQPLFSHLISSELFAQGFEIEYAEKAEHFIATRERVLVGLQALLDTDHSAQETSQSIRDLMIQAAALQHKISTAKGKERKSLIEQLETVKTQIANTQAELKAQNERTLAATNAVRVAAASSDAAREHFPRSRSRSLFAPATAFSLTDSSGAAIEELPEPSAGPSSKRPPLTRSPSYPRLSSNSSDSTVSVDLVDEDDQIHHVAGRPN